MRARAKFSRRSFLRATALLPGTLPLLETDLVRAACVPAGRKRLVIVNWGNGLEQKIKTSGSAFTLPEVMTALEPHHADLIVSDALYNVAFEAIYEKDSAGIAHSSQPSLLVGTRLQRLGPLKYKSSTASLDYFLGGKLKQSASLPFDVLNLGVMATTSTANVPLSTSWQGPAVPATPDDDPFHAFGQLFGSAAGPKQDSLRLVRKSVLDFVHKDIVRFSRNLGREDRERVDGHLASVRAIEDRLAAPPAVMSAAGCAPPALDAMFDPEASANFEKTFRAQIDIGVAALAAGATSVLKIQVGDGAGGHVVLSWLGLQAGAKDGDGIAANTHHGVAHHEEDKKNLVDRWFYDQFASLLSKMKAVKEGSGSMFDNSVVLVTNNMDHGPTHGIGSLPWVLAGTAGGYFKPGRLVSAPGFMSHTRVLVSICNAFGVSADGWADPMYGGEIAGLRG